jgi:endo-1,4-beta-xylanase
VAQQTPAWFFTDASGKPNTPQAQIERMRNHIETWPAAGQDSRMGRRERSHRQRWLISTDCVVNGVGNGDSLVANAFRFAALYAPGAELYYNDFNWRPAKREIVRFVRMLQRQGVRIDGVGMQGHWGSTTEDRIHRSRDHSFAALAEVMITGWM